MRLFQYVGPAEIAAHARHQPGGTPVRDPQAWSGWITAHQHLSTPIGLWATYTISLDGVLHLAPRGSEHVACASGKPVLGAGELLVGEGEIIELTNNSTGYCPDASCWSAVKAAVESAGIEHPGRFTFEAVFRRCEACGERNLVKEQWFECALCGADLPEGYNF